MSFKVDPVAAINTSNSQKVWKIRVRVVRLWRSPDRRNPQAPDFIDMVLVDAKNDSIHCTVWSDQAKNFEGLLREGMCYEIVNPSVALNSYKFKPTLHPCRLYFRGLSTTVKPIEDPMIPIYGLNFTDYKTIFESPSEESNLVDVIGVVTSRGEPSVYTSGDKSSPYIVVELNDLRGEKNMVCTLWEDFAKQFLQYIEEGHNVPVIIILKLARMKFFRGQMGVCNTNYNSKLLINHDIPKVHDLHTRYVAAHPDAALEQLAIIPSSSTNSITDDVLNTSVYKSLAHLKNTTEDGNYITYGTVKDLNLRKGWSYRGCPAKNCLTGVKESDGKYFCRKCNKDYDNVTFRYNLQLMVAAETHSATFTLFDREATNFLKKSASELQKLYAARALPDEDYPEELDTFKEKAFIFKVQVKTQFYNYTKQTNIQINRLIKDDTLIKAFVHKSKLEEDIETPKQSKLDSSNFSTPCSIERTVGEKSKPIIINDDEDTQMTTKKIRKLIKQEDEDS